MNNSKITCSGFISVVLAGDEEILTALWPSFITKPELLRAALLRQNSNGQNCLMGAVKRGHWTIVHWILRQLVDTGLVPLFYAAVTQQDNQDESVAVHVARAAKAHQRQSSLRYSLATQNEPLFDLLKLLVQTLSTDSSCFQMRMTQQTRQDLRQFNQLAYKEEYGMLTEAMKRLPEHNAELFLAAVTLSDQPLLQQFVAAAVQENAAAVHALLAQILANDGVAVLTEILTWHQNRPGYNWLFWALETGRLSIIAGILDLCLTWINQADQADDEQQRQLLYDMLKTIVLHQDNCYWCCLTYAVYTGYPAAIMLIMDKLMSTPELLADLLLLRSNGCNCLELSINTMYNTTYSLIIRKLLDQPVVPDVIVSLVIHPNPWGPNYLTLLLDTCNYRAFHQLLTRLAETPELLQMVLTWPNPPDNRNCLMLATVNQDQRMAKLIIGTLLNQVRQPEQLRPILQALLTQQDKQRRNCLAYLLENKWDELFNLLMTKLYQLALSNKQLRHVLRTNFPMLNYATLPSQLQLHYTYIQEQLHTLPHNYTHEFQMAVSLSDNEPLKDLMLLLLADPDPDATATSTTNPTVATTQSISNNRLTANLTQFLAQSDDLPDLLTWQNSYGLNCLQWALEAQRPQAAQAILASLSSPQQAGALDYLSFIMLSQKNLWGRNGLMQAIYNADDATSRLILRIITEQLAVRDKQYFSYFLAQKDIWERNSLIYLVYYTARTNDCCFLDRALMDLIVLIANDANCDLANDASQWFRSQWSDIITQADQRGWNLIDHAIQAGNYNVVINIIAKLAKYEHLLWALILYKDPAQEGRTVNRLAAITDVKVRAYLQKQLLDILGADSKALWVYEDNDAIVNDNNDNSDDNQNSQEDETKPLGPWL